MGFKCPNCNKDFGYNQNGFRNHLLFESGRCRAVADGFLKMVDIKTGKKKLKNKTKKSKQTFSFIDKNHCFMKRNLVSNGDLSDNVECINCGLKAKRYINGSMKFDKRISYKKIEKCIK